MSTACIRSRTRTLDRPYQSQELHWTQTESQLKYKADSNLYVKPEEDNNINEGTRKEFSPLKNEGQDQHLDTTSEVFKKIVKNSHRVSSSSLYSKVRRCDPPVDDGGLEKNKIEDNDQLRRFRWTSATRGGDHQQQQKGYHCSAAATTTIKKFLPKNKSLSQKFSLFPSVCSSHLEDFEKEQLRLRQGIGHAVAKVQSKKGDTTSELERWSWKCSNSKLRITKRFEFFETRNGDHNICYFSLENTSSQPIAYKISSTNPKLYLILPSSTNVVPPGKTVNISMTASGHSKFRLEDLENDEIIFESYFLTSKKDFDMRDEKSSWSSITVKTFFVHPCDMVPMRLSGHHSCPIIKFIPPPPPSKKIARRALLTSRNDGERIFEELQSKFTILYPQMKRLRRQNFLLSTFFNLISYSIFVGLLGYAVHLASTSAFGGAAKLKEVPVDYSDSSQVIRWFYEGRDSSIVYVQNSLLPVAEILTHSVLTVFITFVQHPLTCLLDFLNFVQ